MISPSARLLWLTGIIFIPTCALPAFVPHGERYIALAGTLIVILCLIDWLFSKRFLSGLIVTLPEIIHAVIHNPTEFSIYVHSKTPSRRRPRQIRIGIALPLEIEPLREDIQVPVPKPQQTFTATMSLRGEQRGQFPITHAFAGAISSFGLFQFRRTLPISSTVLIEPSLAQISKEAAKLFASHQRGGHRIVPRNGRGREFEQLRDYVPSDDFGDMDWKATARRRSPIVREYQIERQQDVYACIDFSRLSAQTVLRKDELRATVLDEYIRSTLMLHCSVRQAGDHFGFATFSNRVDSFIRATNTGGFDRLFRQALYPLRPSRVAPAFDEICSLLRTRIKRRALIVFFTSLAEPQLADAFFEASRLLVREHLVVVACPADAHVAPLFSDSGVHAITDVYDKLAGHLLWKKLAEIRARLTNTGIRMHIVPPGRLGLLAATEYLDIKERQLL